MSHTRYLALVSVLTFTAAAHGATIYVDADNCPGPGDGSVGNPYCSIQTAIDNAVDTDEILPRPALISRPSTFSARRSCCRVLTGRM